MKEIKKEDIINEAGIMVDFEGIKNIANSGIENCICRIILEKIINGKKQMISGTGFFCEIPEKKKKNIYN